MKLKVLSFYNRMILFFLSVFGLLPSCKDGSIIQNQALEYGTPWARYKVSGAVLDKKTNQGIENIGVLVGQKQEFDDTIYFNPLSDTLKTNTNGEFMSELNVFPISDSVQIKYFDLSNPVTYQAKDTTVYFDADELQGGGDGWFSGETSTEVNTYLDEYE